MRLRLSALVTLACLLGGTRAHAQASKVFLRVEPGGPNSVITSVAFSPDGERLYAAGFDKVVRVWAREQGRFQPSRIAYRVPVGPGFAGAINALAVSPDGNWLAAGGVGVMRGRAAQHQVGMVFPASGTKTPEMLEDEGTIFVFNVHDERTLKILRGHAGDVLALTFLPPREGKPPLLVSAAAEREAQRGAYRGHLRLWDVARAASVEEQIIDTAAPLSEPGLTAWHSGPRVQDVGVAVAWHDGQVRLWDVAGRRVEAKPDGKYNYLAAPAAGAGSFWTASFQTPDGVLRLWQERPQARPDPDIRLAAADPQVGPFQVPLNLATFSSRPAGAIDRAVVLARSQRVNPGDGDPVILYLFDLVQRRKLAEYPLGPFQGNLRRVAVSPDGIYIAVADADEQQVRVFTTAEFLAGQPAPHPQVLRGAGTRFKTVSFRKKGDDRALFLEEAGGEALLFDFTQRRLRPDDPAWLKDAPNRDGWRVEPKSENGQLAVTVSGPGFPAKVVHLDNQALLTAGALLPPRSGEPFGPVFAAACLDAHGQPRLTLYDVASGTQVRQLAGHVGVIRSLAFSADGRRLASTADDHTVCLWSMTSLGQVLGTAGGLPRVKVLPKPNGVEVDSAPADSPLQKGMLVEGFVANGQLQKVTTPYDFYKALFDRKPGTTVTLRTRPAGAAARDVSLTIGQGTDERQPLLSLFVTRDGKLDDRHWIAWTALGPYDVSSRRAEDYLGWHFNPEKPGEPVAFVRAEKYRNDYEMRGILEHVVRRANAGLALEDYRRVPPRLTSGIEGIDPSGPQIGGRPLVRNRDLRLWVEIPAPFPLERVSAVRWRLDQGAWQSATEVLQRKWSEDLAALAWGRGPHVLALRLEADGGTSKLERTEAFHYLPNPPRVRLADAWRRQHFPDAEADASLLFGKTKEAAFRIEAVAEPGTPAEKVRATVRHNGQVIPIEGATLRQEITLQEGDNTIEIGAVNVDAPKNLEEWETAEPIVLKVSYFRDRPAPHIVIRQLVPLAEGAEPQRALAGQPNRVGVPRVRIEGHVQGEESLTEVKRDGRPLGGFEAGKKPQFDFAEEIILKPGPQEVRFESKSEHSPVGRETLRLEYQPPVPRILQVSRVDRPDDPTRAYQSEVEYAVRLAAPEDRQAFLGEVLVNNEAALEQPLAARATEFRAKASLKPGPNTVVIQLRNQWGAVSTPHELRVQYLRPPRNLRIADGVPRQVETPVLRSSFSVLVDSPAELPPVLARLEDRVYRDDQLHVELLDRAAGRWKVTLKDVPLRQGNNRFTLRVANVDGESPQTATAEVSYDKPLPPRPVVRFPQFQDGEEAEVGSPDHPLDLLVQSDAPLLRVELRGPGDKLFYRATEAELKARKLEKTVSVALRPETPTTFYLRAENEGGEVETRVTLKVPRRPAYVVIDRLESARTPGRFFEKAAQSDAQGRAVFDVVPEGRVVLHGRILWDEATAKRLGQKVTVRVYANGFQQIPVIARPPENGVSTFQATVLLTRPTEETNLIEVDLPDVQMADGQHNSCIVRRCTNPIRGRRLHLVIVGVGGGNGAILREQALAAIGARRVEDRYQAPPAFEQVEVYEPLVGQVSQGRVLDRLRQVKSQIRAAGDTGRAIVLSEVVLVYYQGQEQVTAGELYLLTDDSEGDRNPLRTGVTCEQIAGVFDDVPGAQVVMLDVRRAAAARAETVTAFEGTRVGLFHSLWQSGSAPPGRFLAVLKASWNRASTLGTLAREVEAQSKRLAPQLDFRPYLPGELTLLEFGGRAEPGEEKR